MHARSHLAFIRSLAHEQSACERGYHGPRPALLRLILARVLPAAVRATVIAPLALRRQDSDYALLLRRALHMGTHCRKRCRTFVLHP